MEKKVPMRTCIACRVCKPKKELVRIVKSGEQIKLDRTGKMNGRGAYICKSSECLAKAIKTKALERSLQVQISSEIYEQLKVELGNE
jgi:predicted RNA-binding protein YlxR (DUF448 family)